MSISPLQRSLFQITARQSRLAREAQLHAPTAGAHRRGKRRKAWQREHNSRRSGQALLLAVLLMVFAALLGSTFITVVSLNLNQTARQQNLGSAQASANAGLTFINDKLNNSALGERWRPFMIAPPPPPGDPDFNFYYSAFDRAQGWTNNVNTIPPNGSNLNGNAVSYGDMGISDSEKREEEWLFIDQQLRADPTKHLYVKFPDPRGAAVQTGAPQFLAELRPNADGTVRVDVIGQSSDDPSVFVRETRAKPGAPQNPLVSVARTVTNWDFTNNVVPSARIKDNVFAGTSVPIQNISGILPPAPFYITISDLNTRLDSALVTAVTPTAFGAMLTFSRPLVVNQGDFVQVAAALGTPAAVDYDADGTQTYGGDSLPGNYRDNVRTFGREAVAYTPDSNQAASILVNGGLAWMGNVLPRKLGQNNSFIRTSGLVTARAQTITLTGAPDPIQKVAFPQVLDINGTSSPANLLPSNNTEFPFVVSTVPNQTDRVKIVNDGYDRLRGNSDGLRNADSIKPPDVSSGGSFSRYLNLTKYSPSVVAGQPSASAFGQGEGIYIDNTDDTEKVIDGAALRPMTDAEFKAMLFSDAKEDAQNATFPATIPAIASTPLISAAITRQSKPYGVGAAAPAAVAASLEQKHRRGWIGPDEFMPRGTLIELDPAAGKVYITRDDMSDSSERGTNTKPDTTKVWRDGNGVPLPGVYKMEMAWPANGTIYAEGNVRVKGGAFTNTALTGNVPVVDTGVDPGRSISIVSGNNIYIEGSLNAGSRKVILLAKKNVILNPTREIARVQARALVKSTTGARIELNNAQLFKVGDWIEKIDDMAVARPARVTAVALTNPNLPDGYIDVTPSYAEPLVGGTDYIRAVPDPYFSSGVDQIPFFRHATRLSTFSDVIQRDVSSEQNTAGLPQRRFAIRHSAESVPALKAQVEAATTPTTTSALLTNKLAVAGNASVITSAGKTLNVDFDAPMAMTQKFPAPQPLDDASAAAYSLFKFAENPAPILPQIDPMMAPPTPALQFNDANTTLLAPYLPATDIANAPRFYFLAALGNRLDFGTALGTLMFPFKKNALTAPVTIPMGTSVAMWSDGIQRTIESDTYNATAATYDQVGQFGFAAAYGDPAATIPDPNSQEDVLTIDEHFYRNGTGTKSDITFDDEKYTLDARKIPFTGATSSKVAFLLNDKQVTPAAGDTVSNRFTATTAPIPYYRLSRLKLENPINPLNAAYNFTNLTQGATIQVNAFVYAQEGSWLVVPGGDFDATVKTSATNQPYVDFDNSNTVDAGEAEAADLNRDGTISRDEQTAVYRFRRYNYKINFTGAIMEKTTAVVADERDITNPLVVTSAGQVQSWMDKWSTVSLSPANYGGSDTNPFDNTTTRSNVVNPADPTAQFR